AENKYLFYTLKTNKQAGLSPEGFGTTLSSIATYYDYAKEQAYFVDKESKKILLSSDGLGNVMVIGPDGYGYTKHIPEISEYLYKLKINGPRGNAVDMELSGEDIKAIYSDMSYLGSGKTETGGRASATGVDSTSLGYNSIANHSNSIALGANSVTTRSNEVSIGTKNGETRIIGGVSDGKLTTDAATVGQLYHEYSIEKVARIEGDAQTLKSANTYTNKQVNALEQNTNQQFRQLRDQINKNRKRSDAGIAGAMAMTAIPMIDGKQYSFGMAASNYRDEQAIAAGIIFRTSENTVVRLNTSWDTQHGTGVATGMSIGW
ncbi:TPA: autoagglutinating adhesin Saa, partial [Escherichia coli]